MNHVEPSRRPQSMCPSTQCGWRFRAACLALGILGVALSGCVGTQPTDPYAVIPGLQREALVRTNNAPSRPLPVQGPLTRAQAIEIALANNPEIAAVAWDTLAAENRREYAQAGRWPILSAEAGYGHFLDAQRLIPTRYNGELGVFDRDIYRSDLIMKVPLFTGGKITSEIQAAELLRLAEEKRLARSKEELVFNVSSTFYVILSQLGIIRSLEFSTKTIEEHRKQILDLMAAQKAARVDLLRAEVRLADLRHALIREQQLLAIQKRLLINLMGVDSGTERITLAGTLPDEPSSNETDQDAVRTALRQRGDYLAARDRLEAQAKRVDGARAGYWPTVNLMASYGVRGAPHPEDKGKNTANEEDVAAIGMVVTVPLFEGGRTAALVRQEFAALAAAQERLRKLEQQICREVETAVLNVDSSRARIEATRSSIEQAQESLRIERMKYDLGSGSVTDLLDAQSALLQSETNFARAVADFHIAMASLQLATGGSAL